MSILSSTSGSSLSSFLNSASASAPLSVGGLISGIDTTKVIQGLLAIDQQKIDDITSRVTTVQRQQTAFKGVEAKLLALQTQIGSLSAPQNSVFNAHVVQVSDTNALSAAASSSAVAGDYHLRVNHLALADQLASQGFDSATSAITHGTLSLRNGTTTTNVTVDGTNDTLQGLASAINASGAAVSASVINDGSGDNQQGYRLVLASRATGTANRIVITNNLGATAGGATRPILDTGAIGNVILGAGDTGTSAIQSNAGAGYTGTATNAYRFTITQGGTVGTDDGIQLSYTDTSGSHTGTVTLNHGDAGALQQVAQGIGVQFAAGTLVMGDTFTIKAFAPTVQAAADASITLGSGDGAITVTNGSNTIDSVIPGVTLALHNADPNHDITLSVANNTDGITSAIQSFISSYNDVIGTIDDATSFNGATSQAGPLLGNTQILDIEQKVRAVTQNVIAGANSRLNNLGALGITTGDNGQLVLNSTKLSRVLGGGVAGVTLEDVRKLFALSGSTSNAGIPFVTASASTRASTTPYTARITQAAQQASLTAANAAAPSTVIDNTNNSLVVSLDGVTSSTLTLAAGTYTASALAQALQSAINNDQTLAGRQVAVGLTGANLTITSSRYGTASRVSAVSGNALAALGFTAGATAQGTDVQGGFLVNNVPESAHGTGQFLLGDSGNPNTAGLQLRVTLTPAQVGAGLQADVTIARGVASQLDSVLARLFDPVSGRLKTIDDGFTSSITQLDDDKAKATDSMNARQAQLQEQFNAMEQALASLQSASNLITLQQASLTQKK